MESSGWDADERMSKHQCPHCTHWPSWAGPAPCARSHADPKE